MSRSLKLGAQAVVVAGVLALLALLVWRVAHPQQSNLPELVRAGKNPTAPSFSLPRLDQDGRIELAALRGKAVVINFWASWCGPCLRFAPVYERASDKHADITFSKVDTEDQVELAAKFDIRSIPTIMAIRDGVIVFAQPGALPESALESLISQVRELDMDEVREKLAAHQH